MRFEPFYSITTVFSCEESEDPDVKRLYREQSEAPERQEITCPDVARRGQLAVKLEEYAQRAETSANPRVVRDAICKIAVIDKILLSEDSSVSYFDAFDYAKEGVEMYGADLLFETEEETLGFFDEFDTAFDVVSQYVDHGVDANVTGGTRLPDLS